MKFLEGWKHYQRMKKAAYTFIIDRRWIALPEGTYYGEVTNIENNHGTVIVEIELERKA